MSSVRTLAEVWPELGTDERLSIFLEQQTASLKERVEHMGQLEPVARGRLAGYTTALADILYFVVEGNPLATEEDL